MDGTGENLTYQSKLMWEHLQWTSLPMDVLLRHEVEGPTLEVRCRQFAAMSPEQTRLFYKHGSGWNWIESTPYALSTHEVEDIDQYVLKYTSFYLTQVVNDGSWLGQVFAEAQRHLQVSATSRKSFTKLRCSSSGPVDGACTQVVGRKSTFDEELVDEWTRDPRNVSRHRLRILSFLYNTRSPSFTEPTGP